jgi:iron(III) transport system ATP-binding protein
MIKKLQMTAIHITHDQHEAMGIADSIICMRSGRIEQMGDGRDLYYRPRNRFIADFIGTATFIESKVLSRGAAGEGKISLDGKVAVVSSSLPDGSGDAVLVAIRPESVWLSATPIDGLNVHKATVLEETFFGSHTEYVVDVSGLRLGVNSPESFKVGAEVYAKIAPDRVLCLPG